ncbi:MAG: DNA gyrase/topoisomerase IV subunit A [Paludibacteraceae bacterium]|nr:DNA gyrase/topoisomerase IV subunit A [Paludibacteraceae bacterium]
MAENEDELNEKKKNEQSDWSEQPSGHSDYVIPDLEDEMVKRHLSGMYQNWFLDYASYVILDRAVPHLYDGFKPVQRRILHSMKRMDDGRYNKVANIVGHTMQFHPHGDSSIYGALVQIGQKNLLVDCQGNWGNILTGDEAAAARYIEARLSEFAKEVLFNAKTTDWKYSYDGRNLEPVVLPVKFPLLLVQGVEGIAVGLQTRILPHNFNEVADACISYLRNEPFELYPDFVTGGYMDVSHYLDGRGRGRVRVRAKITKIDNKTLCISELPFGITTEAMKESIQKAIEKGKIQIKKVDDNTAAQVELLVQLAPGKSSDKTIDALYAFTSCEVSIAPNCCVIYENKPHFMSVSEVLKFSTDNTLRLLKEELLIRKSELQESLFFQSLERIFIEERIYKDEKFEKSKSVDEALAHIDKRLEPFKKDFIREVERDDLLKLLEIKMARILRFSSDKADANIAAIKAELKEVQKNIKEIVPYTIAWFEHLKTKYGAKYPRHTEIRNFDTIEVVKVVEANEKLYINREEGFIGIGSSLKKDEYICNCSDIDDLIVFFRDGRFKVIKVAEKVYVGKDVIHVGIFKKNDSRTIYNMVYRNGSDKVCYVKRFAVTGVTRDKEYNLTMGTPGTRVLHFSANANGEAEVLRVSLKPKPRLKSLAFDFDFASLLIKGRASRGNVLSRNEVLRVMLKKKGGSTLGGRPVWFDNDVLRLNYNGHGQLLGEFQNDDSILAITKRGTWITTSFELSNHYPDDLLRIERFKPDKVWTAVLIDADQNNMPYIKRFTLEQVKNETSFLGDNPASKLLLLTDTCYPRIECKFGEPEQDREPLVIDAEEFIGLKSFKAKGKRVTTFPVAEWTELEPLRFPPEPEPEPTTEDVEEEEAAPIQYVEVKGSPNNDNESDPEPADAADAEEPGDESPRKDESGQLSLF